MISRFVDGLGGVGWMSPAPFTSDKSKLSGGLDAAVLGEGVKIGEVEQQSASHLVERNPPLRSEPPKPSLGEPGPLVDGLAKRHELPAHGVMVTIREGLASVRRDAEVLSPETSFGPATSRRNGPRPLSR
jgi:hypothetical protein